ncbi:hypothetical protein [Pseudomonas sp. NPDC087614]|uniref:hypothetical protein n=1 Tax=Pseudomonas sp. NPDC087614 TaxID=3364442 RepID=UPI003802DA38
MFDRLVNYEDFYLRATLIKEITGELFNAGVRALLNELYFLTHVVDQLREDFPLSKGTTCLGFQRRPNADRRLTHKSNYSRDCQKFCVRA